MADIRIVDLPLATGPTAPSAADAVALDGLTTRKATLSGVADAIRPIASQAEAEAGVNSVKGMSPLTVKQAILAQGTTLFASAEEGNLATSAMQQSIYDSSAKGFNVYAQAFRDDSPRYYGAVGNGIANDGAAYTSTEGTQPFVFLPSGSTFNIGANFPVKPVHGPGSVAFGGNSYSGSQFAYDPYRSSVLFTPDGYTDKTGLFPSAGHNLSMFLAPGAIPSGSINRSSFFGSGGPQNIVSWDRVDASGNQSLWKARLVERIVAKGSLTYPWLSSNNPNADLHAWWHDTAFIPGQVGWDAGDGIEVRNPGMGAQIAAFSDFVTDRAQASRNVAVGRNAGGAAVRDINSTYAGYRAGGGVYVGSKNAAFGADALYNGVFVTEFTAVGAEAARYWQTGTRNLVGGRAAAANAVRGSYNVVLGSVAGDPFTDLNDCVLIGVGAGNNVAGTSQTDILVIGNRNKSTLLSGRFDTSRMGVNVLPTDLLGNFHVRSAASGLVGAVNANADEFVIEGTGTVGLTLLTGNTGGSQILFADTDDTNVGGVLYDHTTNNLTLRAGDSNRFVVTPTGFGFNGNAPTARPTITGSRGGNAALQVLLAALDSMGLVINSSTA